MKIGILHTAFLGDLALLGLMIEVLHYEGHEIFLFTNSGGESIYASDLRIKNIYKVNKYKPNKIVALFKIAALITKCGLNTLIVPHKSLTSTLISKLSRVQTRIGFDKATAGFLYDQQQPYIKNRHEVLRLLDLLPASFFKKMPKNHWEKLGRPFLYGDTRLLCFHKKFSEFELDKQKFFIVAPSSVWATKKYPAHHFAQVILKLLDIYPDMHCIVIGGPTDQIDAKTVIDHTQKIQKNLTTPHHNTAHRIWNAQGILPLAELIELTRKAQFIISNDSAPIHVAAGVNTPTVAVFGPTLPHMGFAPTSQKSCSVTYAQATGLLLPCQPCSAHGSHICPKKHHRCMEDLPPQAVVESVANVLKKQ